MRPIKVLQNPQNLPLNYKYALAAGAPPQTLLGNFRSLDPLTWPPFKQSPTYDKAQSCKLPRLSYTLSFLSFSINSWLTLLLEMKKWHLNDRRSMTLTFSMHRLVKLWDPINAGHFKVNVTIKMHVDSIMTWKHDLPIELTVVKLQEICMTLTCIECRPIRNIFATNFHP